jgi:hypothetical protein
MGRVGIGEMREQGRMREMREMREMKINNQCPIPNTQFFVN